MRNSGGKTSALALLVIVGLLAVAGSMVLSRAKSMRVQSVNESRVQTANIQMQSIAREIARYQDDCGAHPPTLSALVSRPAKCHGSTTLKATSLNDPWGQPIQYFVDGAHYRLVSFGEDKREGGEGNARDIVFSEGE